ncbi:hypothetical protein Dsin_016885 [Dipteronia sinensis]|uniref:K+ potassium transporter integral membrane domain-containing protein n=1 Tax=Dipteronia sinensis TaxID=43782 RepID=A0AAE0E617_9ROSI|nr:hypothetical protein Dsin_016885 [Dipteronia sinensis]
MYWPMFVVAVLAADIASQAMISGSFSIIQQSLSLGCFHHVKVMHTSANCEGHVYIPEINYLLMLACIGFTLGFRTTEKFCNACACLCRIHFRCSSDDRNVCLEQCVSKKVLYELDRKIPPNRLKQIGLDGNVYRIP